jgi:hypothetical protein
MQSKHYSWLKVCIIANRQPMIWNVGCIESINDWRYGSSNLRNEISAWMQNLTNNSWQTLGSNTISLRACFSWSIESSSCRHSMWLHPVKLKPLLDLFRNSLPFDVIAWTCPNNNLIFFILNIFTPFKSFNQQMMLVN